VKQRQEVVTAKAKDPESIRFRCLQLLRVPIEDATPGIEAELDRWIVLSVRREPDAGLRQAIFLE
jgi:hypothetical protein